MTNLAVTASEALRTLLERAKLSARAPRAVQTPPGASILLSSAQRRVWELQHAQPQSGDHSLVTAWRLRGELDVERLRAAVATVLSTHDVLRTRYVEVDGSPIPRLGGTDAAAWSRQPRTYAELAADVSRPFDLATEPALRATLLKVEPDEHVFALRVHQIAADSWSMGVLVADLAAAYAGRALARPVLRYTDVARWRAGVGASEDLAYWRVRLAGASVAAALPADRPRQANGPGVAETFRFSFESDLTSRVRALADAEHTSTFTCLLAGLAALYARCTGDDDVLLGSRISGRESAPELSTVVGPLANTLLLRTTLAPRMTGRELIRDVHLRGERDMQHSGTALERVAALLPGGGSLAGRPYRIQLVGTDVPEVVLDLPGLEVVELLARATTIGVDMSVSVEGMDGGLMTATVTYNADLFDESTIELFSTQLQRLLAGLVADPEAEVRSLDRA